jgi:hypothetical protein
MAYTDRDKKNKNAVKWYQRNKDRVSLRRKELRPSRHALNPEKEMFRSAKQRAKRKGIPFNIEKFDIIVPKFCPLLGIELFASKGKVGPNSPSLDRIIPSLGYVKGNIMVISNKANSIKQDATVEELERLVKNLKSMHS